MNYSGVVVEHNGLILLCKRSLSGKTVLKGYWGVPCGAVESGEAPFIAAQRELEEEAGIIVNPSHLVYFTALKAIDGGRFNIYLYRSKELPSVILDQEHTEYGWFKLKNLSTVNLQPMTDELAEVLASLSEEL